MIIYSVMLRNDNVSNPFFVNNAKASLESMPFVFRLKLNLEKILDNETNLLDVKLFKPTSLWGARFKRNFGTLCKITYC